ncbi:hypothetical protein Hanom_Chr09g00786141 [Helianthus anomalus]
MLFCHCCAAFMCFSSEEPERGRDIENGISEAIAMCPSTLTMCSSTLARSSGTSNVESRRTRGLISSMSSSKTHGVASARIPASDNVVLLDLQHQM